MQGLVKDEALLDKEETKHSMLEIKGHQQVQEALLAIGMKAGGMESALQVDDNSRHGWVPHTLIFNWLQDAWAGVWTPEVFWNMIIHTKSENQQH
eukprot:3884214-Heterocapsa_arctica.AAC.1